MTVDMASNCTNSSNGNIQFHDQIPSPMQSASGDSGDYFMDYKNQLTGSSSDLTCCFLENCSGNCGADKKTNLIVNYLPPNMTQEEVRNLFASQGEVESCKLVRDKTTGESLGYSFVKFVYAGDAEKAIRTLNGLRLQNKTIKVSLARPSSDAIKGANLYICGLPKQMGQYDLEALFSQCGKIITARILYDNKTGVSRGVAFIRFDQRSEADYAIKKLNGFVPSNMNEPITVKFANSPSLSRQEGFGSGFGFAASLFKQASNAAAVVAASVSPTSSNGGNIPSRSSSLVSPFQQISSTKSPISKFQQHANGLDFGNMSLLSPNPTLIGPAFAASSGALTATGWSIFVYNLAPETDDATLWRLFGPFGAVQTVKVIRDPADNKCRGFGFVTMSNYEEALLAIQSLNGFNLGNRVLQVSFKTTPNPKQLQQTQLVRSSSSSSSGNLGVTDSNSRADSPVANKVVSPRASHMATPCNEF